MRTDCQLVVLLVVVLACSSTVSAQDEQPTPAETKKQVQLSGAAAKWFEALDKNSDGRISKAEAGELKAFPKMDSNGNGFASKEELTEMAEAGRHSRAE